MNLARVIMGIIKRMLRRTIAKINPTISSHELVLNPALNVTSHRHHDQLSGPTNAGSVERSSSKRSSILQRRIKKCKSRDLAAAEALLLASRNYLPPVQFHHIHGSNARLSSNKCVARRTQGFCQSLVFSNRVILPNERVYIKVLDISKVWSGTIRFGFTAVDPATLAVHMPKHACPDMTNAGHTWARALADEIVKRNSVIHFSYNKDGLIYYGINNQDCGIFYANVNSNQNLWFIVDIYGKTTAVELIDPRVHNASNTIDFSQLNDELNIGGSDSVTMLKSTCMMDGMFERYGARSKRKRSRKLTSAANALLDTQWSLEDSIAPGQSGCFRSTHQRLPNQLANFNFMMAPSDAQQNIYSPMPSNQLNITASTLPRPLTDLHDYHQIMTSHQESPYHHYQRHPATRVSKLPTSLSTNHQSPAGPSSAPNSSSSNDQAGEITRRLSGIQLTELNIGARQQQQVSPLSPTSSPAAIVSPTQVPIAAARRRLTSQMIGSTQTSSKRSSDNKDLSARLIAHHQIGSNKPNRVSANPSAIATRNSVCTIKPKSRHSNTTTSATQKSTTATTGRDSNNNINNGPPSKDCPICFERPINCVLYQCGHMCTCYECGVKQWKTQSRTCPICRTVIKDVIKTYMS